jgi:hypothetical protein
MAAIAAGHPAARLVAKKSDARRRELSSALFQFHGRPEIEVENAPAEEALALELQDFPYW